MVRVPYVDPESLTEEYRYLFDDNVLGERNIFLALANNPPVLQSFMRFGNTLWQQSGIERSEMEIVILSVARAMDAKYEWHQHVPMATEAGLSQSEIRSIARGDPDDLSNKKSILVRYASAVATGTVEEDIADAMTDEFDPDTVVATTLLAGYYVATARTIDALQIDIEGEFVGWYPDE